MPHKTDAANRWGGPGASDENRDKQQPDEQTMRDRLGREQPYSHVSGGGGERDRHHGHDAESKRDREENSIQKRMP